MIIRYSLFVALWLVLLATACQGRSSQADPAASTSASETLLAVGAARLDSYLPLLREKRIGMVVNHTSTVGQTHLVDTLLALGVDIAAIFAPEHGFRGAADAGAKIEDSQDPKTGIPLLSLYGSRRKPRPADLEGLDLILFDIQDVGARFYTYISTMHYVMEACAENGLGFLVLDRPNPNGHYVDGPMRQEGYASFVGMHPVPVVHGMTVGEYAQMVNGEGWLADGLKCDLTVIPCSGYDHQTPYELPIPPSPNLPNQRSIYLYPWLCFFEGTVASVGRGTTKQFQVIGHPDYPAGAYTFVPEPRPGAMQPKLEGETCRGYDLSQIPLEELRARGRLDLQYLINFYRNFPEPSAFFLENGWVDKLAGGPELRQMIEAGASEADIRASWVEDLKAFAKVRKKYLLYPDN